MPLIVPILSRKQFTDALMSVWNGAGPLKVHLFKAAHTPVPSDVLATYLAIEADFGGYAPQLLIGWLDVGLDADDRELCQAAPNLFVRLAGANDVYGYFVTDAANSLLWWAEQRIGGPIPVNAANPLYAVLVRNTATSEF